MIDDEVIEKWKYRNIPYYECKLTGGGCHDGDCRKCNVPIIKAIKELTPTNIITAPMSIDMERKWLDILSTRTYSTGASTTKEAKE